MRWLNENALLTCEHLLGVVKFAASQSLVRIGGRRVLVRPDPEGRSIVGCPNIGPTIKPCTTTLAVLAGTSAFVRIAGVPVCLETVRGRTDGTPPGVISFVIRTPGQDFVGERP